jgi:hypothetical protein
MPDRSAAIITAVEQMMASVSREMLEAAREANVSIDVTHVAHASGPMATVTNAGITGAEKITEEQLKQGAELMFIHISPLTGKIVPPGGFYTVKITADLQTQRGKAVLIDRAGKTTVELPVQIEPGGPTFGPTWRIRFSAGYAAPCFFVDVYVPFLDKRISFMVCVT